MRNFTISCRDTHHTVDAEAWCVTDGTLIFSNNLDKNVVVVFAAGYWLSFAETKCYEYD